MSHAEPIPHDAAAPPAFDAALWSRLRAMQLDAPDASLTFTRRLARENGWSVARAREVVEEYRRFLYLAARAGHPVTPSDAVDQAWHLHLVYTRHYWSVLCREVLGFDLHHGPTLGGEREQAKFGDWYSRTLESYRSAFGEPPAGIWPGVEDRFEGVERMQRVDLGTSWVIPKPSLRSDRALLRRLLAGLAVLAVAVCLLFHSGSATTFAAATIASTQVNALDWITWLAVLGAAICWIAYRHATNTNEQDRSKKNNSSGCGGGCGGGSGCGGGGCGGCGG
jgi:hypothetical protein